MTQKELTKTFMMISSLNNLFGFSSYTKIFQFFNPYNSAITLYKSWRPKGFFQFEIIISVSYSAGIDFRCQNLTSKVYPRAVRVRG